MLFHPQPNQRPALSTSRTPHQGRVRQPGQVLRETFLAFFSVFLNICIFLHYYFCVFISVLIDEQLAQNIRYENNCLTNTLPQRTI